MSFNRPDKLVKARNPDSAIGGSLGKGEQNGPLSKIGQKTIAGIHRIPKMGSIIFWAGRLPSYSRYSGSAQPLLWHTHPQSRKKRLLLTPGVKNGTSKRENQS